MSDQSAVKQSLYERLGGRASIEAAVDIFYEKVMADRILKPWFAGVDLVRQRGKQKAFLSYAFGGPANYSGKNLRDGHEELVANGLSDEHFDAVAGHLQATLVELGVPEEMIGEVMTIAGSTRDDVLGR